MSVPSMPAVPSMGALERGLSRLTAVVPLAPNQVADLAAWHKADSLGLADLAAVASWSDSSGNAVTASNGTIANRPVFRTNIVNGLPIVRFNGTTHELFMTLPALGADFTVITVSTPGSNRIMGNSAYRLGPLSGSDAQVFAGATPVWSLTPTVTTEFHITSFLMDGANSLLRRNGNPSSSGAQNPGGATLSGSTAIGSQGTAQWWAGDLAEMAIFSRKLTAKEALAIERGFGQKYAITVA